MLFDQPMIWLKTNDHNSCYFCRCKQNGFGKHMSWDYPIESSGGFKLPIKRGIPQTEYSDSLLLSPIELIVSSQSSTDSEVLPNSKPKPFSQEELNDLVKDLELTKEKAEILASRLKERFLVVEDVKVSHYRNRHESYAQYFTMKDKVCFCHDIFGLFNELGQFYDAGEWRLFIDSSKESLKAVLLHNGNEKPSIPLAHAVNMKESYDTMAKLLHFIKYKEHNWKLCCDLKVVAMLSGLQGGYTKHCCFLCLWDSRDRAQHYTKKDWPKRDDKTIGAHNIKYLELVKSEDIILPPLHIKLGLIKNFVKTLDMDGEAFSYLRTKFSSLSFAKIKEGVFDGPQIKKLLSDNHFESLLSSDQNFAWRSFRLIVSDFLGNKRSPEYETIVNDLLKNYEKIGKKY